MRNPCNQTCPDRTPECKISCPKRAEYLESLEPQRKARHASRIIEGFICDSCFETRRRAAGRRPVAWPGGKNGR